MHLANAVVREEEEVVVEAEAEAEAEAEEEGFLPIRKTFKAMGIVINERWIILGCWLLACRPCQSVCSP